MTDPDMNETLSDDTRHFPPAIATVFTFERPQHPMPIRPKHKPAPRFMTSDVLLWLAVALAVLLFATALAVYAPRASAAAVAQTATMMEMDQ